MLTEEGSNKMERTNELDAKTTTINFDFPRGYLLEDTEGVHVLNKAQMREMTGYEEDILADDKSSITQRMHDVVGNCLISLSDEKGHSIVDPNVLKTIPLNLLMSDIVVATFRLREVTVGSEYRQKVACPNCIDDDDKPNAWTAILNLSDFKSIPASGDLTKAVREFETKRGNKITWEMLSGAGELAYENMKKSKERATAVLMARIRTINGQPATKDAVKRLPMLERQEIRKEFDVEGGIETSFDSVCKRCKQEFKTELEMGGSSFFSRLATPEE